MELCSRRISEDGKRTADAAGEPLAAISPLPRRRPRPPLRSRGFSFALQEGAARAEAEALIARTFANRYGARIRQFMPQLMGLRSAGGELIAACGLRPATTAPLFLETYLDAPLEAQLRGRLGFDLPRAVIVEVGNLAVARDGYAPRLIAELTAHLERSSWQWVAFTAVPVLRNAFLRLGIPLLPIAPAPCSRLTPAERKDWGTYYDVRPQVMAVSVSDAHAALFGPVGLPKIQTL